MLIHILTMGLIFSILGFGVHLSYKLLNFPDLTVDGSFPLGAAICAVTLTSGMPLSICLLLSFAGGSVAGLATAVLNTKLRLTDLLSGILTMIALYSINLRLMGRPNMPLLGLSHVFQGDQALFSIGLLTLVIKLALDYFYKSKLGMALRASGENPLFIAGLGLDPDYLKILGLMISNGLVALSGGIMALYQGFADIGMGLGMMVAGLASVIIGQRLIGWRAGTSSVVLGSLIYRAAVRIAFALGLPPGDLKLITALLLILILSPSLTPKLKRHSRNTALKRRSSHAHL